MPESILINGVPTIIEYRNVRVGDTIYDKNSKSTYIANEWDADEAKWVVINQ